MKKAIISAIVTLLGPIAFAATSSSVYTLRPNDPEAVYFTPENYPINSDGSTDVTVSLQKAVNDVKEKYNFGIVFIPEGKYMISNTIYIPNSVRLIGYGGKRPLIFLKDGASGYQQEDPEDKGKAKYMFWFTSAIVREGEAPQDATSSTFYSALSNIDLKIGKGNPYAVALRTHYAQHSFISYSDIHIDSGKAGIFDVGNELESVRFFGGDYGIYTTKTSPSWQMTILNAYFEGQRKAAILTQEGGLTIIRMNVHKVPVGIELQKDRGDKIYMEDCRFYSVGKAISIGNEGLSPNQLSMRNVVCSDVPQFLELRDSREIVSGKGKIYRVNDFSYGLHLNDMAADPQQRMVMDMEALLAMPSEPDDDIKPIPDMSKWVNIRDLGAAGDGVTDDTEVFRKAIADHETIYVPQGWYVVTDSIVLKKNTALIGLNPVSTQIQIKESTPAFSGFGAPKALLETPQGGCNFVSGIGLNTGAYNYRVVGCKWMAGADSYMNDIKFFGHNVRKGKPVEYKPRPKEISSPEHPVATEGMDKAWDNQHWTLWITNGGGGVFKDIWTANTYATSGLLVTDTDTPARIYEMSVEHHVRNEVRFKNVSNWKIYALQLEEETPESLCCQQIELQDCHDLFFANLYLFRVIWIETPARIAIRTWDCKDLEFYNVHNFTQMRFTTDIVFKDMNTGLEVRPWEFTRLTITGKETAKRPEPNEDGVVRLATGFEFAEGMTRDSKGNVYFSEQRGRRIYKWDVSKDKIFLVTDLPWQPLSLACDTEDHLLVIYKYFPQPGFAADTLTDLPDKEGTTFCLWGNTGFSLGVYSIDPDRPEETLKVLPKVPYSSVPQVSKAIYPAHRWRDLHDFDEVSVWKPQYCFMAPDGKTIVPEYYDFLRSSSALEAIPGQPFYSSDEYNHLTVRTSVSQDGSLSSLSHFATFGEFGSAVDEKGNVYIADGNIYVYSPDGQCRGTIHVPERPTALTVSGNCLYIAARTSLYRYEL